MTTERPQKQDIDADEIAAVASAPSPSHDVPVRRPSSYNARFQSILLIIVLAMILASIVVFVIAVANHEPNDGPRNPFQSLELAGNAQATAAS